MSSIWADQKRQREVRQRKAARGLALSAGEYTVFVLERDDLGSP
jgi:hypothetical protein